MIVLIARLKKSVRVRISSFVEHVIKYFSKLHGTLFKLRVLVSPFLRWGSFRPSEILSGFSRFRFSFRDKSR